MGEMNVKKIHDRLIECGIREYTAKVYTMLFSVGIAKASELHKLTGIPRGRIYETLDQLVEKGLVTEYGTKPTYYCANDAELAYQHLQELEMQRIEKIGTCLKELQSIYRPSVVSKVTEFHTPCAITTQVDLKLKRAKIDILIVCNDKESLKTYADIIAETAKRIPVYLLVANEEIAEAAPIKCYMTQDTIQKELMGVSFFTGKEKYPYLMYFYCDRESTMGILRCNETIAYSTESDVYANFVVKSFLNTIKPVKSK
jgi:sugar-specific transcriptional regulator TrmB